MLPPFNPPHVPFMGAGTSPSGARAILFGAPYGTPYAGIDNRIHAATARVLRASFGDDRTWVDHWNFDFDGPLLGDSGFRFADLGDLPATPDDGPGNRARIEAATRAILAAGAVPVMIGGDDSVPIPFIAGFAEAGPLTIVQVDAHIDWRNEREGERLGYSSTMRRASEMAHVEAIVQVGMRGLGSARKAEVDDALAWGARIVTAREFHRAGPACVLAHIRPGARCLITFDCDALDCSVMPAVMAPTPGGLSYDQTVGLIAAIAGHARIAGFDLIEFVPERDANGTSAVIAAQIVTNVIARLARQPYSAAI